MTSFFLILSSLFFYFFRNIILLYGEFIIEWEIIRWFRSQIFLIFIFDYISVFFLSLVRLISGRVLIFRTSYMSSEKIFSRFLILVILFVFSIALLILSPNIIRLLLGWDGLGVTSYLLVVFYQSNKSYNAGIITALTNRIGDVGILICIGIIFYMGDWSFLYFRNINSELEKIFLIILVISACTKRAQIPFSAWLPAAIAAPTPVSALVHSSTLVTAGVYLLIRFNYILARSFFRYFLIILGSLTILIAGIVAVIEIDIKKVIALSTLSQLGVIIIILGGQKPLLAYFHLLSHAYFKAILFICAGIIIHNIKDYQDIRTIGRNYTNIPVIIRIFNIANISLCGLPFLRGFYSKDIILEIIIIKQTNIFFFIIILAGTFFTVYYSCRLTLYLRSTRVKSENFYIVSENDKFITLGIIFLLPFAIIGGINLRWIIISYSPIILMPLWIKSIIIILIILAIITILSKFKLNLFYFFHKIIYFINRIIFLPNIFRSSSTFYTFISGKKIIKIAEMSWVEIIIYQKIFLLIKKIRYYFSLLTEIYFLSFFISIILIFFIFF